MAFKPSKYQRLIYTFIEKCHGNAVVNAVAGSGKSTTIVNALRIIPSDKKVLFLAFNKSIVEELAQKVKDITNVEVSTLHSLGCKACMRLLNCSVNEDKYKTHFSEGMLSGVYQPNGDLSESDYEEWKSNIRDLIDLGRVNLIKKRVELEAVAEKFELYLVDNELDMVMKILRWGILNSRQIDFTDMIYFPVIKNLRMNQYDWVFIDECQDLNACQRELFQRCVKSDGGRWIAVGDERQAIYGFAGADTESYAKLKAIPNTATLPLSICYRCDENIIRMAKPIVPQIEWRDGAESGVVNKSASLKDVRDGDMVLCRLSAPLTSLCMKYLSEGIKAYIKGKKVGENLINIVKRTKKKDIKTMLETIDRDNQNLLERIAKKKKLSLDDARENSTYVAAVDKYNALVTLSAGLKTSAALINRIFQIFSDADKSGICLSTIHKSKGLEADRVFIICEDTLLFKPCMRIPWQAEQEYNLVYVAYTRAKHHLGFIQDFKYRPGE